MITAGKIVLSDKSSDDEFAALRGDGQDALAALFLKHHERLERMVALRLNPHLVGRVDPADVLQEAYIEVARRIESFLTAPTVSLFVWMRQITWQTLLDIHRRHLGQKRNAAQEVPLRYQDRNGVSVCLLAQQLVGTLTSPSQAAVRNERMVLLQGAIERMDERDREILALRHFEQLTNGETAEVLNVSKTAASNRYVRALKRLRDSLDAHQALRDE